MKDKVFGVLQRVGRSFMLPIAILPVAGLLLGIGGSFTNETMLRTYGLDNLMGEGTVFHAIFTVMSDAGNIVFGNLPLIFAIGVAIGMAKKEKDVAALAAAIAFFIMHASIGAMITINGGAETMLEGAVESVCGITSLQMGVFGGILVGIGVAALHNRFYKIELPQVLSFFGGARFVPIISALVYTAVGIVMFFIWPPIQRGIYAVGDVVLSSGYAGTWLYGFMERLLIPFGLHHVFYLPFWQTGVGGSLEVAGKTIEGAQNIFFAQLADPTVTKFAVSATRFMAGKFPLMIFGLPGAALAMYQSALPEKRKAAGGLLLSAALTSMLTGITEPLEFTFLFVAPLLYGIHCVFAGLAYMLMHILDVGVGMTFSGGLIDLFLFGILQGNAKTNWIRIPLVGIFYFLVYYVLFYYLIRRLDLKTPGRDNTQEVKLYRRSDVEAQKDGRAGGARGVNAADEQSALICSGLGGKQNISDVDCCATRLRCTVYRSELVDDALLKASGASGVIHKGNGVQVIYGPRVTVIKANLEEYLEHAPLEMEQQEENGAQTEIAVPEKNTADRQKNSGEETQKNNGMQQQKNSEAKRQKNSQAKLQKNPEKREVRETMKKEPKEEFSVIVASPFAGCAAPVSETPDEVFAEKILGDGMMVLPEEPLMRAPLDGEVAVLFPSHHAVGLRTKEGVDLLIHAGIDTVKLEGRGFEELVKVGQSVKKGDPLLKLDLAYLKENAPSLATPVLCTNLGETRKIRILKEGSVKAGDALFAIEFRKK